MSGMDNKIKKNDSSMQNKANSRVQEKTWEKFF